MSDAETRPFGAFSLTPTRDFIRSFADVMPNNKVGKWGISICRKLAIKNRAEPFDVEIEDGLKLRLHPSGNRCEKRVICGGHTWDSKEHAALAEAMEQHDEQSPFTFMDLGANVGFYSLFLGNAARKISKDVKLIAVEPDKTNASRLQFNAKASDIHLTHVPAGIGAQRMTASLVGGEKNRGEIKVSISESHADNSTIDIIPIDELCQKLEINAIDAMKVDIEGYDFQALDCFFTKADQSLWPKLLIIEVLDSSNDLLELCITHGYTLNFRAGINAVLSREL